MIENEKTIIMKFFQEICLLPYIRELGSNVERCRDNICNKKNQ